MEAIVRAICISEKRGISKKEIPEAQFITEFGIAGDAHAGKWHRQVSLLSFERVEEFRNRGADVIEGSFGENILAEGIDFKTLPIGTKLQSGDIILEITQIGKQCHSECTIYKQIGDCIMPREGVFARVLSGGKMKTGDKIYVK